MVQPEVDEGSASWSPASAVESQGVALARRVLAEQDLEAGRLVRVFERPLPAEFAYYLVCPEASATHPKIAAFRGWILAEVD